MFEKIYTYLLALKIKPITILNLINTRRLYVKMAPFSKVIQVPTCMLEMKRKNAINNKKSMKNPYL